MPAITSAPTPDQFAKAWTAGFAAAVRNAAGKDGRLSLADVNKLPEKFQDNARNYLAAKGQSSVSVGKLIASGYRYAQTQAKRIAGVGNRVSIDEAKKFPEDLRVDFAELRGIKVEQPERPTGRPTDQQFEAIFKADAKQWLVEHLEEHYEEAIADAESPEEIEQLKADWKKDLEAGADTWIDEDAKDSYIGYNDIDDEERANTVVVTLSFFPEYAGIGLSVGLVYERDTGSWVETTDLTD